MKIFVTGGTGFVGRYAVEELEKHGHTLLILSRGKHTSSRKTSYLRGDLSAPSMAKWKNQLKRFKPDVALHMAWEGIPDYGPENSLRNLEYGMSLIRVLGEAKCKKIVATGSCWEYGVDSGKMSEDDPVRIEKPFPAAKAAFHRIGTAAAQEYGMKFVWARIFYVYGPGQKSTSLIPHLIDIKFRGEMPQVKNPDGGNDFVYVGDVARALRLILEKNTKSAVFNLGSGNVTGVREIAEIIYEKKIIPGRGKVKGFYADTARAKKELGWTATVDIKEGIRKMISQYS
jgi:UDP-glucose 4-epimerase